MLPKEHGAYGQLVFPLVTMTGVAGVSATSVLLVAAVVCGFLAHEPWLIRQGGRGPRARRESGARAAWWLAVTAVGGVVAGLLALVRLPAGMWWTLLVPAVPLAVVVALTIGGRDRSGSGEVAAACAFSTAALPVGMAAGASPAQAVSVAAVFALTFTLQTLAVRAIVVDVRGGGSRRAASSLRWAARALGIAGGAALALVAGGELLPWTAPAAAAPGLATTGWLTLFPPPPTRLRTVGWMLVTASLVTAVILLAGL